MEQRVGVRVGGPPRAVVAAGTALLVAITSGATAFVLLTGTAAVVRPGPELEPLPPLAAPPTQRPVVVLPPGALGGPVAAPELPRRADAGGPRAGVPSPVRDRVERLPAVVPLVPGLLPDLPVPGEPVALPDDLAPPLAAGPLPVQPVPQVQPVQPVPQVPSEPPAPLEPPVAAPRAPQPTAGAAAPATGRDRDTGQGPRGDTSNDKAKDKSTGQALKKPSKGDKPSKPSKPSKASKPSKVNAPAAPAAPTLAAAGPTPHVGPPATPPRRLPAQAVGKRRTPSQAAAARPARSPARDPGHTRRR